jgi:hypothetical protein
MIDRGSWYELLPLVSLDRPRIGVSLAVSTSGATYVFGLRRCADGWAELHHPIATDAKLAMQSLGAA